MKKLLQLLALILFTQIVFAQTGNVGIGTATPKSSAALDITDANRGLLVPRVALSATNAAGPITSPETSLLVYNTSTAGSGSTAVTPGYYYNAGTTSSPNWVRLLINTTGWQTTGNTGTTASASAIGTAVNNNFIGNTDSTDFVVATGNLERLRVIGTSTGVTRQGYIGIGTNLPPNKLSVVNDADNQGVAVLSNATSGGFVGLYFNQGLGTYKGHIGYVNTGGTSSFGGKGTFQIASGNRPLVFSATNGAETYNEVARFDNSTGNFGIGLSPATGNRLDVINPTGQTTTGAGINIATNFANTTNIGTYGINISNTFSGTGNPGYTTGANITATGNTQDTRGVTISASSSATTYGINSSASGTGSTNYGIYGVASGATTNNYGVYGSASGTGAFAGYFSGDVRVTNLSGTGTRSVAANSAGTLVSLNRASTTTAFINTSAGQYTYTVPSGVEYVYVELIGGGGGAANCVSNCGGGGGGGAVSGYLPVTAGEVLYIQVGGGGGGGNCSSGGSGGTGSYIRRTSHTGTILCAAGGGGGGSYADKSYYGLGGGSQGFGTSINGSNGCNNSSRANGGNNNVDYLINPVSFQGNSDYSQQNFYNFAPFIPSGCGNTVPGRGAVKASGSGGDSGAVLIYY